MTDEPQPGPSPPSYSFVSARGALDPPSSPSSSGTRTPSPDPFESNARPATPGPSQSRTQAPSQTTIRDPIQPRAETLVSNAGSTAQEPTQKPSDPDFHWVRHATTPPTYSEHPLTHLMTSLQPGYWAVSESGCPYWIREQGQQGTMSDVLYYVMVDGAWTIQSAETLWPLLVSGGYWMPGGSEEGGLERFVVTGEDEF